MPIADMVGNRYGRLTVLEYSHSSHNKPHWLCLCECGQEKVICGQSLRRGLTTSCGCFRAETTSANNYRHGDAKSRLHNIWIGIKRRCENENSQDYPDYGGRGIAMCREWRDDFIAFRNWAVSHGYTDELTIERDDVDGDYKPNNCSWISNRDQAFNRRSTRVIEFQDLKMTLSEFSEAFELNRNSVAKQLNDNWTIDRILVRGRRRTF